MLITLISCTALAVGGVAAVATTGAAVGTDPRSNDILINDNSIQSHLSLQYFNSTLFINSNIYVDVYSGVVLLTGQVSSAALKSNADNMAKGYPNVHKVYNYLDIRPVSSGATRAKDTFLTTEVKAKLLATENIKSNNIKVVTTSSVVYLMGIVNQQTSDTVTSIISQISGVIKVVTLFLYE